MKEEDIKNNLNLFLGDLESNINKSNTLTIDMHCHDRNSNNPSERLGRILGIPETWLKTEELLSCLNRNNTSAITITNHNNAKSCWELLDKGHDILSGAEFTCKLPNSQLSIHVLTYGFTPEQEYSLNRLRRNLFRFLEYCSSNDILTVWAHPLFFNHNNFSAEAINDLELVATLFSHYELINGQRSSYQNLVTANWLKTFDEEKINRVAAKNSVNPFSFCKDPKGLNFVGGSDDHMGLFAGSTGTFVEVENLKQKLKTSTKAELVLEGLKNGNVAPYGGFTNDNKMTVSFLELFYMIVKNMDDPGLLRILLHKGTDQEKLAGMLIGNGISELRRHKFTLQFLDIFHNALHGKGQKIWQQAFAKKSTKELLKEVEKISNSNKKSSEEFVEQAKDSLDNIFKELNRQVSVKAKESLSEIKLEESTLDINNIIEKLEVPSFLRSYGQQEESSFINVGKIMDKLTFPILGSALIGSASYISSHVQNNNRKFLDYFANESKMPKRNKRMLWLTDTFKDKNGVAISLNAYLKEIRERNLPIDILICDEHMVSEKNLIVVKPIGTFEIPFYKGQSIKIPNIMEIHKIFSKGDYDRVISSTELIMGLVSIYIKKAFNVESYFFMHTDWIEFIKNNFKTTRSQTKKIIRISREFYKNFNKIFVLNSDNKKWLSGRKMNIPEKNIVTTKHWVPQFFKPDYSTENRDTTLIYAGRLSLEKGLMDLPYIYQKIKEDIPEAKLIIAGDGPLKDILKKDIPDANFIDWIDNKELPKFYQNADLFLFPSKFDTFGRVVLESISCGCPVAAYNSKGPKDIIEDGECGILAEDKFELADKVVDLLSKRGKFEAMKSKAVKRSKNFNSTSCVNLLLKNCTLE